MSFVKPRLSEKSFALSQATNTFALDVPSELNKHEIAAVVAKQFDVEVKSVRLVNRKGKVKRVMNLTGKRSSNRKGVQSDLKKAYVTLAPGSHLPFFQAEETEVKEAAKKKTEDKSAKTDEKKSTLKKITSRTKKEDK
jgi:large subunit ribosomal protein L23